MPHMAKVVYAMSPLNATASIVSKRDGAVRCEPHRTKVAIIGAGLGRHMAPYEDSTWEVWGLNVVPSLDQQGRLRADRWFELHQRRAQSADDMTWIAKCPFPLYVPDDLLDASPNAVRFPIERVERAYGQYWACTFAYQIALAMLEGFTDIGLYGVELSMGSERERTVEWANVSWWMGLAEGRGVKMHLPTGSLLGAHRHRYGLEYDEEKHFTDKFVHYHRRQDAAESVRQKRTGMGG